MCPYIMYRERWVDTHYHFCQWGTIISRCSYAAPHGNQSARAPGRRRLGPGMYHGFGKLSSRRDMVLELSFFLYVFKIDFCIDKPVFSYRFLIDNDSFFV